LTRSRLELLDLPHVFSQRPLLTRQGFSRECHRRGFGSLGGYELEALHEAGVLRPFYRLRKDVRAARTLAKREGRTIHDYLLYTPTDGRGLKEYRDEGQLHDPTTEPFRPWRSYRREFDGIPTDTSEFLFSHYQLLGVHTLRRLSASMRARRLADDSIRYRLRASSWTLGGVWQPDDPLLVLLTSLEEYYLPQVLRSVRLPSGGEEARDEFEQEFRPAELLAWLGVDARELPTIAERLLVLAGGVDPLGDWVDLVRLVHPNRWSKLQGDALASLDLRIASEMLLLCYEDLVRSHVAPPLPEASTRLREPIHDRLKADRSALDGVLTDYGLSPHPGVLLVLEGATEMILVPKVMKELGIPERPSFLRLFGAGGVNRQKQLELLAGYVATPTFGRELEQAVLLDVPPTHFLVVFDPDLGFDTPERRERQRKRWVDQIVGRLPAEFRTAVIEQQVNRMVRTDTWDGTQVFEYANFTDGEVAAALNALWRRHGGHGQAVTAAMVRPLRPRKDVARLWEHWPVRKPSKADLAAALWPALRRRIRVKAQQERLEDVPVARVVLEAARTAYLASRARAMTSKEDAP
jgi:hypothetical protein